MIVGGIDPGPRASSLVLYNGDMNRIDNAVEMPNDELVRHIRQAGDVVDVDIHAAVFVIEKPQSFNQRGGRDLFETAYWCGRFAEASGYPQTLERKAIVRHLCGNTTSGDRAVRQAVMYRWSTNEAVAFGNKKTPGPLYGITGHKMAALAVAVVYYEKWKKGTL